MYLNYIIQCATDWLTIPCATNTHDPKAQNGTPTVCVDRICGMVFNSATTAANSPNVPVYSKSNWHFLASYICSKIVAHTVFIHQTI